MKQRWTNYFIPDCYDRLILTDTPAKLKGMFKTLAGSSEVRLSSVMGIRFENWITENTHSKKMIDSLDLSNMNKDDIYSLLIQPQPSDHSDILPDHHKVNNLNEAKIVDEGIIKKKDYKVETWG